jgi:hypothetical protein
MGSRAHQPARIDLFRVESEPINLADVDVDDARDVDLDVDVKVTSSSTGKVEQNPVLLRHVSHFAQHGDFRRHVGLVTHNPTTFLSGCGSFPFWGDSVFHPQRYLDVGILTR